MKVLVVGGSGVLGRAMLPLLAQKHEVVATACRRPADTAIAYVPLDLLEPDVVGTALRMHRPDVVVHVASALPAALHPRRLREQLHLTNRLRSEGARNLVDAMQGAGVRRIIAASIAFAYVPGDGAADESTPLLADDLAGFGAAVDAVRKMENALEGGDNVVLRLGFLYGPGTAYAADSQTANLVRKRGFPVIQPGQGRFPFLHVADAAAAFDHAIDAPAGIYNVVEDDSPRAADWLPRYAGALDAKPPMTVPRWLGRIAAGPFAVHLMTNLRPVSNQRARQQLGWQPRHEFMHDPLGSDPGSGEQA